MSEDPSRLKRFSNRNIIEILISTFDANISKTG